MSIPDLLPSKEAHSQWFGTTYDGTPRVKAPIPPLKQRVSSQVASRTSSVTIELDAGSMRMITRFYEEVKARFEFPAKDVLQFTQNVSPYQPMLRHSSSMLNSRPSTVSVFDACNAGIVSRSRPFSHLGMQAEPRQNCT